MERFEDAARGWDPTAAPTDAIAAATAVLLRDHPDGVQVLMLRRNSKLAFVGGAWVFPGGRVDPEDINASSDRSASASDDADSEGSRPDAALFTIEAAMNAARRETMEEAGLDLSDVSLSTLSHWMPPAGTPRRFSTWFFVGIAPPGTITIDGGEIHDHMWTAPQVALERRDAGEVQLAPPTFVTLTSLSRFDGAKEALLALMAEPVERFETQILDEDGVLTAVWRGDEHYSTESIDSPAADGTSGAVGVVGARHRLRMAPGRWEYLRHG